jgi:hypothetical protein
MKRCASVAAATMMMVLGGIAGAQAPELPATPPSPPEKAAVPPTATPNGDDDRAWRALGYPREVVRRMSPEQLAAILKTREEKPQSEHRTVTMFVPIVALGGFFLTVFAVVFLNVRLAGRRDRERHETLRALIAAGRDIPPDLIVPPQEGSANFRRGLIACGGGFGLLGFLLFGPDIDPGVWALALIPICVGAAYLAAWWFQDRRRVYHTTGTV